MDERRGDRLRAKRRGHIVNQQIVNELVTKLLGHVEDTHQRRRVRHADERRHVRADAGVALLDVDTKVALLPQLVEDRLRALTAACDLA